MITTSKHNLRQIKKELTAQILAKEAFELAMEKGLDGYVIEDVTKRAGYSRRTFANYYSCKEEAISMAVIHSYNYDQTLAMVNDLNLDASPIDMLFQLSNFENTKNSLLKLHQLVLLSNKNSSLKPYVLKAINEAQVTTTQILDYLFHGRFSTNYTQLLAGVACSAIYPLIDVKILDEISYQQYINDIYGYLRNGF